MDFLQALRWQLPVVLGSYALPKRIGLVITDEVNGFCTVGMGNLAPTKPSPQIDQMISQTDGLAIEFVNAVYPILVLRDTHVKERPEPPYPEHCVIGTGEEVLVDRLRWLEEPAKNGHNVRFLNKDCISGVVGGIRESQDIENGDVNIVFDWINGNRLEAVIVVGICTDICVKDFVNPLLSARNHAVNGYEEPAIMLLPTLKDVVVYEPGCGTYDLPLEAVLAAGLPATAAHPAEIMHHFGLVSMASRGAILANELVMPNGRIFKLE